MRGIFQIVRRPAASLAAALACGALAVTAVAAPAEASSSSDKVSSANNKLADNSCSGMKRIKTGKLRIDGSSKVYGEARVYKGDGTYCGVNIASRRDDDTVLLRGVYFSTDETLFTRHDYGPFYNIAGDIRQPTEWGEVWVVASIKLKNGKTAKVSMTAK